MTGVCSHCSLAFQLIPTLKSTRIPKFRSGNGSGDSIPAHVCAHISDYAQDRALGGMAVSMLFQPDFHPNFSASVTALLCLSFIRHQDCCRDWASVPLFHQSSFGGGILGVSTVSLSCDGIYQPRTGAAPGGNAPAAAPKGSVQLLSHFLGH